MAYGFGEPLGSALQGKDLPFDGGKGGHNCMPQSALEYAAKRRQRRKKVSAESATVATGNGQGKVRLLVREQIDGRTKARRQFDAIAEGIAEDLGGEDRLSTVQRTLVEAFAGAAVHVHDLNARLLLGQEIDITAHASAISVMVRIAARIGINRVASRHAPPDPLQYAREASEAAE
jgi:hypothetical protein